jgi:tetratricopeptide (TPR) repeat protein
MALCLWLVVCAAPNAAVRQPLNAAVGVDQDALARAKDLYASARFEDALQILEALKGSAATPEAGAYQAYCLVALGRRDEARRVIERVVRADPLFRPQEGNVAPHIQALFDDTRRPLLPVIAHEYYAAAKAAFDTHEMARAVTGFDREIAILDQIGGTEPGVTDLRAASVAFRDLSRALAALTFNPTPNPSASSTAAAPPAIVIYDAQSADVVAPAPISTPLPDWHPGFFELNRTFSGEVQLVIGEDGSVMSALITRSVHASYDGRLLEATKGWTFKPATKDGMPVKYRYLMTVRVLR